MTPEPMNVDLSLFERLEILRQEQGTLEKELDAIERSLNKSLTAQARTAYLETLAPYYKHLTREEIEDPAELEGQRQLIHQALESIQMQVPLLEEQVQGAPAQPARRVKRGEAPIPPGTTPTSQKADKKARRRIQGFDNF